MGQRTTYVDIHICCCSLILCSEAHVFIDFVLGVTRAKNKQSRAFDSLLFPFNSSAALQRPSSREFSQTASTQSNPKSSCYSCSFLHCTYVHLGSYLTQYLVGDSRMLVPERSVPLGLHATVVNRSARITSPVHMQKCVNACTRVL